MIPPWRKKYWNVGGLSVDSREERECHSVDDNQDPHCLTIQVSQHTGKHLCILGKTIPIALAREMSSSPMVYDISTRRRLEPHLPLPSLAFMDLTSPVLLNSCSPVS